LKGGGSGGEGLFPDGVYFAALAPISDPGLVVLTIAQALGVKEIGSQPLLETLKDYLREKQVLLLLDNFEQVLDAAPLVAELLAACPKLKALVTSREMLHLYGEHDFPVPPLALPDRAQLPPLDQLTQYEAVRLFIERAQAIKPDFQVTNANANAVAEICARLDGLPLAIELAAAWVRLFSPQGLLARLQHRLALLTGGARDLPARHQTIRGAIDWSYNLLSAAEQALFARLGVFVGGCTLEAASAVCNATNDLPMDVTDGIASLLDKSLLRLEAGADGEPRFMVLETIREYALERLEQSGEIEVVRRQHAFYFLALAEQAELQLRGAQEGALCRQLESEHDNLRAALRWYEERGDSAQLAHLGAALWWFWLVRGHWSEGRGWLEQALARDNVLPAALRAKTLLGAGWLTAGNSDFTPARALLEESLGLFRELRDVQGIADALNGLAIVAYGQSDYTKQRAYLDESLALCRELGDKPRIAKVLDRLGVLTFIQGDLAAARALKEESLTLYRELGMQGGVASALDDLGLIALVQGDYAGATSLIDESVALYREVGDPYGTSSALNDLGQAAYVQGDYPRAAALWAESLTLRRELGDRRGSVAMLVNLADATLAQGDVDRSHKLYAESLSLARDLTYLQGISWGLMGLGKAASVIGNLERAARLWGAAESLREAAAVPIWPDERRDYERIVATARAQLGEDAFATAWAEGHALPLDQAIAYALEE
jgi:predicted ATPase